MAIICLTPCPCTYKMTRMYCQDLGPLAVAIIFFDSVSLPPQGDWDVLPRPWGTRCGSAFLTPLPCTGKMTGMCFQEPRPPPGLMYCCLLVQSLGKGNGQGEEPRCRDTPKKS